MNFIPTRLSARRLGRQFGLVDVDWAITSAEGKTVLHDGAGRREAPARRCRSSRRSSLDDLVDPQHERRRDREAKCLRGPKIHDQLEGPGLLDGQVARLRAFQDLVEIGRASCRERVYVLV